MQQLFNDVRPLDKKIIDLYEIPEDILMENAAAALEREIYSFSKSANTACFIVCGSGNNGGDGIALARRLAGKMSVVLYTAKEPKTEAGKKQLNRTKNVLLTNDLVIINNFDAARKSFSALCLFEKIIIVECLFGSGFHGQLRESDEKIIDWLNSIQYADKIACDIPAGIDNRGNLAENSAGIQKAFAADCTVTMGALKTALYSSAVKDYTGKIICADLGISYKSYTEADLSFCKPEALILEQDDFRSPVRKKQNVHKGSFGHVAVIAGEKKGAAVIAGSAAFAYGAGLVTIVTADKKEEISNCPFELMQSQSVPETAAAVAVGMGLGRTNISAMKSIHSFLLDHPQISCILDADMFFYDNLSVLLEKRTELKTNTILTPHPKEFMNILKLCHITKNNGEFYSINEILKNKLEIVKKFCKKYTGIVLLLKDANPVIACNSQIFINPLGKNCLAKGGSGDVLSGIIAAVLCQQSSFYYIGEYFSLTAAIQGSLAHAMASLKITTAWGMTPLMLIEQLRYL